MWSEARIDHTFSYHSPADLPEDIREKTLRAYGLIREWGKEQAHYLRDLCPGSPELTRAINKIQEAVMLANAAIALNGVNHE